VQAPLVQLLRRLLGRAATGARSLAEQLRHQGLAKPVASAPLPDPASRAAAGGALEDDPDELAAVGAPGYALGTHLR